MAADPSCVAANVDWKEVPVVAYGEHAAAEADEDCVFSVTCSISHTLWKVDTAENTWVCHEYWPVNSDYVKGLGTPSEGEVAVRGGSGVNSPSLRAVGADGWSRIENTWRSDGVIVEEWRRLDSKSSGSELAMPPDIAIRLPKDWRN